MTVAVVAALVLLAGPRPAAPSAPQAPAARTRPAVAAVAAQPDAPPVKVDAAEVHYAPRRREVVFTGNPVTMTRDDARLTCTRLVARNDDKGEIVSAVCTGDVRFVRGERSVTCDTATYDNAQARLTCEGNATLREVRTEARGERLTYDLRSDETSLVGGGGRSVVVTVPGEEIDQRRREYEERKKARQPKAEARP
jgi:lipopolysaccharide export system protein LptA